MRQRPQLLQPDAGGDEQHHGETDAADIGFDAEKDAKQIAEEHPDKGADREQGDAENRHAPALPAAGRKAPLTRPCLIFRVPPAKRRSWVGDETSIRDIINNASMYAFNFRSKACGGGLSTSAAAGLWATN